MATPDSAGLQLASDPFSYPVSQHPQQLVNGYLTPKQYYSPAVVVGRSADESPRSGFCGGRRWLVVVGLLVACVIAAAVGGAVGGTRHRHNVHQVSSLPRYSYAFFLPFQHVQKKLAKPAR